MEIRSTVTEGARVKNLDRSPQVLFLTMRHGAREGRCATSDRSRPEERRRYSMWLSAAVARLTPVDGETYNRKRVVGCTSSGQSSPSAGRTFCCQFASISPTGRRRFACQKGSGAIDAVFFTMFALDSQVHRAVP